jgi:D-lactate dehydrogenase
MDLARQLARILTPDRVLSRWIDRIAYANDASVYRLVPRVVVRPRSIEEVRELFRFSRRSGIPLTFRASGTSLSGQAVTDGILAVVSQHWRSVRVEQGGRRVRVQPGVIGGVVNRSLHEFGTKIGPDPASLDACAMGGILANNSSGMCCGVQHNAYHTLESISFVLPDGLTLDTEQPDASATFAREAPDLARGLLDLKARIESDAALCERIRSKYRMKNTMGYSINAFLDYPDPLDILAHLMIGSEGTLGFIAGAVLRTVPDHRRRYTGLLYFPDVPSACAAIGSLRESGARALELMDRASLRSIEEQPGVPSCIRGLSASAAAILVEYQCRTGEELERRRLACRELLPSLPLVGSPSFTGDPARQAQLWRVRKGIIPSVGAMRARGTSCIIEDVVFPLEHLAAGVAELQRLFAEYRYDDAIIFGHAKDGNLHFVLNQALRNAADAQRYDAFMCALAELVAVRHGGALKAEHGTGRNMAPFVATEWGEDAWRIMRDLKRLIDPGGLLNPGVILNDDPRAHVSDLKALPAVEPEVDLCIECGFCEPLCPSRDLTLTPRQRIVVRREMARLRSRGAAEPLLAELEADFAYAGVETCATDGLCAMACPVGIDTGALVRRLRRQARSDASQEIARLVADRLSLAESIARLSLRTGRLLGRDWPPPAGTALPATSRAAARAVYLPSCVSRVLGPGERRERPVAELLVEVSARAGLPLWIPRDAVGHCCGLPFSSKGFDRASRLALNRTIEALWSWTDGGELPVVVDSSPCAHTLKQAGPELTTGNRERMKRLRILDSIEFAHDEVLPRRPPHPVAGRVALHPVCSVQKMNLEGKLLHVAGACADAAEIPRSAGCCGFAGDRGFTHPELTEAATRAMADEVATKSYVGFYSSSRTCEIGMSRATGRPYRHVWSLLEWATRRTPETACSDPPQYAGGPRSGNVRRAPERRSGTDTEPSPPRC